MRTSSESKSCSRSKSNIVARRLMTLSAAVASASIAGSAHATDIEKANNSTNLNLSGSYSSGGPPGTSDRILVDSVMATTQSALLGGNLSIAGILVDATATKTLTIGGSNTLTLGASGISIASGSGGSLVFNGPAFVIGASQTWDFSNKSIQFNSTTLIANSNLLTITGTSSQFLFHNGTTTLDALLTGSFALTLDSSPAVADMTLTNAASTFSGGAAISTGSTLEASSMKVSGGTSSAIGTGSIQLKGGTFKYTGNTASTAQGVTYDSRFISTFEVTTSGQTLTLTSLGSTNTANPSLTANGFNLGGAGNIVLSSTALLKDSTNAQRTTLAVTKYGGGSLEIQGSGNTLTGATSVSGGTLLLTGTASINTSSGVGVANAATFTNNSSVAFTKSITLAEGATLNGTGTYTPAGVNVTGDLSDGFTTFDLGGAKLTEGGALVLTLTNFTQGTYTLFNDGTIGGAFTSLVINGTSIDSTGSGNFANSDFTFTNGTTQLQLAVAPEPTSLSILGGGVAAMLMRRRRRA